jgi:predicted Fe-Mo cluster-binding NifX family protein
MPPCRNTFPRFCLACHGNRLASLLETASLFRIYRLSPPRIEEEGVCPMPEEGLPVLAAQLRHLDVAVLVCGGATCCCLHHFRRAGVAVAPWLAGDIDTVLTAILENRLETLLVPGARPGRALGTGRGIDLIRLEKTSS